MRIIPKVTHHHQFVLQQRITVSDLCHNSNSFTHTIQHSMKLNSNSEMKKVKLKKKKKKESDLCHRFEAI